MRIKDILNGLRLDKQSVIKASSLLTVVLLCGFTGFTVQFLLKAHSLSAAVIADSESSQTTVESSAESSQESIQESTSESTTIETTESSQETTEQTTATTETVPTETTITEEEIYLTVYADSSLNVRSGPGTEYDIVKSLNEGDQIDVIALTSNGWYKTYNGNYVSADHTTDVAPTNTPTPTPKPTSATTTTHATTQATTQATTETTVTATASNGVSCRITFYGPQDTDGDGVASVTTASGTTCTEGRTVAADWSIFPKGTTIYIENDPLGGDGYYTVEDKGSAVKGYMIDIYVDNLEGHRSCYRNVTTS